MTRPTGSGNVAGLGAFSAGPFLFEVDDGYTAVELNDPREVLCDDLDVQLLEHAPDLNGAPIASWVLARLFALASGKLLLSTGTEVCDDGLFVVDVLVSEEERIVAKLQLQGGMIGVGLLGMAEAQFETKAVEALVDALTADEAWAECLVSVCDPAWEQHPTGFVPEPTAASVNRYGWDGERFLGADNIEPK